MLIATFKQKLFFLIFSAFLLTAFFSQVFSGRWILPQTMNLGFIEVRFYGIFMAAAVLAGYFLAKKRVGLYGFAPELLEKLLPYLVVGGLLGARLYHVLSDFEYYWAYPLQIFQIWQGGLSIYGGVIGGLVALLIALKRLAIQAKSSTVLNWLTPSLIIGQMIGRLGNLFNYELYGYPTSLPWKMFVSEHFRLPGLEGYLYFHPWFLYELLGLSVVLALIWRFFNRGSTSLFLWYVLLYNLLRFALEFLRPDSPMVAGIRQNAAVSLGLAIVASLFLLSQTVSKNDKIS